MQIREHRNQHDAVGELPIVSESAVVTDITAMDRNRTTAIIDELRSTLDNYGADTWRADRPEVNTDCQRWLRTQLDKADHLNGELPLSGYVSDTHQAKTIRQKVAALQERYLQPSPALFQLTVETDKPVRFAAGQYLAIRYDETSRVYSIASPPEEDPLEFCIRRVPGGRFTSDMAVQLSVGDTVTLRGPYGDLLLEDPSKRDMVFLATGTGVAPFKSMITACFERGMDRVDGTTRDVWLILGGAWADSLPYREKFHSLAATHDNFHFVPTVSRESYLTDWSGESAYVQHVFAKYIAADAIQADSLPETYKSHLNEPCREPIEARLNARNLEVYACGLNAMVSSLVTAAQELGVPPKYTQFEGFG